MDQSAARNTTVETIASEAPPESEAAHSEVVTWRLDAIVAELRFSRDVSHNIRPKGRFRRPPSREAIASVVDGLSKALFPAHYGGPDLAAEAIDEIVALLGSDFRRQLTGCQHLMINITLAAPLARR